MNPMAKPNDCTQMRRVLRRYELLDLHTGQCTPDESRPPTWVVEPCAVPLFSDAERERGTCNGCASGWQCPENMPVAADSPTVFG